MKHLSTLFCALACAWMLLYPSAASAMSFAWVPKIFRTHTTEKEDTLHFSMFECRIRNSWGNCVVFSYTEPLPRAENKTSYWRATSSGETSAEVD